MSVAVGYTDYPHEKSEALKERFAFAKRVLKEALDVEVCATYFNLSLFSPAPDRVA
jgi:hypothetical protein